MKEFELVAEINPGAWTTADPDEDVETADEVETVPLWLTAIGFLSMTVAIEVDWEIEIGGGWAGARMGWITEPITGSRAGIIISALNTKRSHVSNCLSFDIKSLIAFTPETFSHSESNQFYNKTFDSQSTLQRYWEDIGISWLKILSILWAEKIYFVLIELKFPTDPKNEFYCARTKKSQMQISWRSFLIAEGENN